MPSILEMNLQYAKENNLPIAATYEKILATPGGATLFDNQYNKNNWEDLAEPLAEQLSAELSAKGKKKFLLDNAEEITYGGVSGPNEQDFNNFVKDLNTLPLTEQEANKVNTDIQTGSVNNASVRASMANFNKNFKTPGGGWGNLGGDVKKVAKDLAANPVVQIATAYYMPGIVESFAPSLASLGITNAAAQTAVANAIASTAVQVANGVPIDKALQNAVTNAAVSTGSVSVAKALNSVISNPAVTDAIVSAGSSAAKTKLNGGSKSDIEKNFISGLVGSVTATTTGSNVAGGAVGGSVTGGVTGALQGAASALGKDKKTTDKIKPSQTSGGFISGTNLAAANTGTVSDAGDGMSVDVSGTPIFADSDRAAGVKAPFGFAVMPIEMADNKPKGAYYDYTQNAWIAPTTDIEKFTTVSSLLPASADAGRVSVGEGVDLTQPENISSSSNLPTSSGSNLTSSSGYNPNIISTGGTTPSTGGKTTTVAGKPGTTPSLGTVNVTGKRDDATPSLGTVNVTGKRDNEIDSLDTVNVKGTPDDEIDSLDEVTVTDTPDEDVTIKEKETKPNKYDPNIFTYGGVKPTTSTLTTTLNTDVPFYPTTRATGGLTSTRGAGEIESKETGKARKNVWNEASLRLKDALGV